MSTVAVLHGTRRTTIRTTPTTDLSTIRTLACQSLSLSPPSAYTLQRNKHKLDLSLQLRFTNLSPGAKLELVPATASKAPITILLRTVDPVSQLQATFPPTATLWQVLAKFEEGERGRGNGNVNITQRGYKRKDDSVGYLMPAVRVAAKEITGFEELGQELSALGVEGRVLMVLRFLENEAPYAEAMEKVKSYVEKGGELELEPMDAETKSTPAPAAAPEEPAAEMTRDVEMTTEEAKPAQEEPEVKAEITVFQPPSGDTPSAAKIQPPEHVYEPSIASLQALKESYHKSSLPQRLPSDAQIAAQKEEKMKALSSIPSLTIRIRFPDGYLSQQTLPGDATSQDLYAVVRQTLRHPEASFSLVLPPKEKVKCERRRLTTEMGIRSGALMILAWDAGVPESVRKAPALREDLVAKGKELPKTQDEPEYDNSVDVTPPEKQQKPKEQGTTKEGIEKKLKGFLRLGKK